MAETLEEARQRIDAARVKTARMAPIKRHVGVQDEAEQYFGAAAYRLYGAFRWSHQKLTDLLGLSEQMSEHERRYPPTSEDAPE
jgi:hypothetical protein